MTTTMDRMMTNSIAKKSPREQSGRNAIAKELRYLLEVRRVLKSLREGATSENLADNIETPMGPVLRSRLILVTEYLFRSSVQRVCKARRIHMPHVEPKKKKDHFFPAEAA